MSLRRSSAISPASRCQRQIVLTPAAKAEARRYKEVAASLPLLVFDLFYSGLYESFDECGWHRLIYREVDRTLRRGEALEFVLERFDNRRSGKQTAVVREGSEPHQHATVLKRRNPVTDYLGRFR